MYSIKKVSNKNFYNLAKVLVYCKKILNVKYLRQKKCQTSQNVLAYQILKNSLKKSQPKKYYNLQML